MDATTLALKRRRNRQPKACRPCRQRKVKCDLASPCMTCRRRDHVHLCLYESRARNPTRRQLRSRGHIPSLRERVLNLLDKVRTGLQDTRNKDEFTGEVTFLGRYSPANFFRQIVHAIGEDTFVLPPDLSIESAFSLTNRTTLHPFGNLWTSSANRTLKEILETLPNVESCLRYYRVYQQIVHPIYSFILDTDDFERRFCNLMQRTTDDEYQASFVHTSKELAWHGLLFAVLASGCQVTDPKVPESILTVRVFIACAFECLRLSNLYVQPSVESVQTMLIIESVIANDSNPAVAWSLLGITARQAQGLGLHLEQWDKQGSLLNLWDDIIEMDCKLSSLYDRAPIILTSESRYVTTVNSKPSYADNIHRLFHIRHSWLSLRFRDPSVSPTLETLEKCLTRLEATWTLACDGLQGPSNGQGIQTRLERLLLEMHYSDAKAEMSRLGSINKEVPPVRREQHFQSMIQSMQTVIRSFLALKHLSPLAVIAWDILSPVLSSAFILAGFQLSGLECCDSSALLGSLLTTFDSALPDKDLVSTMRMPCEHGLKLMRCLIRKRQSSVFAIEKLS